MTRVRVWRRAPSWGASGDACLRELVRYGRFGRRGWDTWRYRLLGSQHGNRRAPPASDTFDFRNGKKSKGPGTGEICCALSIQYNRTLSN